MRKIKKEAEIDIMTILRDNKHKWITSKEIWIKVQDKYSYYRMMKVLKNFRDKGLISFDKYQDLKKGNYFEYIWRYKEDALDKIIVDNNAP